MACPLCDVDRQRPGDVVWPFPHSVALIGPWQYYTGYCVLVSRLHAAELHHLPAAVRSAFFDEMIVLAQAIESAFHPRKLNCEMLGNQVAHPHWHLFPRSADDPDTLKAVWLAIDRADRDEGEKKRLQTARLSSTEITGRLRQALQQLHAPTL